MEWTDANIEALYTDYIVGNLSARQTGLKVGKTRNAVIGKGHRRFGGLQQNGKPKAIWTLEQDERLRRLRSHGHSFKKIGIIMTKRASYLSEKFSQPAMVRPQPVPEFRQVQSDFPGQCEFEDDKRCRRTAQRGYTTRYCAEHLNEKYVLENREEES